MGPTPSSPRPPLPFPTRRMDSMRNCSANLALPPMAYAPPLLLPRQASAVQEDAAAQDRRRRGAGDALFPDRNGKGR